MGIFSSIAEAAKRKIEEKQQEAASASETAAKMKTEELMHVINENPYHFSITRLGYYAMELKHRLETVNDSRLKMEFNMVSQRNKMFPTMVYGDELVRRGFAEKEGGFYTKIGKW